MSGSCSSSAGEGEDEGRGIRGKTQAVTALSKGLNQRHLCGRPCSHGGERERKKSFFRLPAHS